MKNKIVIFIILAVGCLTAYLYTGAQYIYKDHMVSYEFFVKKHLTTKFIFYNPVLCAECDFTPYDAFNSKTKQKFQDLCYYRYDLQDIGKCEDLFNPEKTKHKL